MLVALQTTMAIALIFFAFGIIIKMIDIIRSASAPKIQTPASCFKQINDLIAANPAEVITELGCGNGKFLKFLASTNPKSEFIGIDNGLIALLICRIRLMRYKNVKIRLADITKEQKFAGTKFYGYLSPTLISVVALKLPRGASLVSLEYAAEGMKPLKVIKLKNPTKLVSKIYVYKMN